MELSFQHAIPRPLAEVERTLLAPGFAERLARDGGVLASGEELGRVERGDAVERTARFVVAGAIPLLGRFGSVGWREVVAWSRASHQGTFVVTPDLPARLAARVRCGGTYALEPAGAATRRSVQASVELAVPLARGEIEHRIAALLARVFDAEARVLGAEP